MSKTIGEIVREALPDSPIQMLHECLVGAQCVNARGTKGAKKGREPYTRITFATTNMTPDDALWFSGDLGRSDSRKPRYIGIVVWVPTEAYESATSPDAVDPVGAAPAASDA